MTRLHVFAVAAVAALLLAESAVPAASQTPGAFYEGKTVTYVSAGEVGGGYDTYGRLVAAAMQNHVPGSTFVVKNIPGAGHLIGTNTIYAAKPDGLTIGTFNTGLIYNQLLGLEGVKFDLTKMSWIGKAASESRVVVIRESSPIKSFQELATSKEPVKFFTSGFGSADYVGIKVLEHVFKLNIQIMPGYEGNEGPLAMRRGEVDANLGSLSSYEPFVKNGYGRFVLQIGGQSMPGIPQAAALVETEEAKSLIALVQSQAEIARLTAGPPNIPSDRLEALRTAYRKAMDDEELKAKVQKLGLPLDPAYGEDVAAMVKAALVQPETTKVLLANALEKPSKK